MYYFKPFVLFLLAILIVFSGCKKSQFKRKLAGVYTGTCVARTEDHGIIKDTTFTTTVTVAWQEDTPHGKNAFTISSRDMRANAWFSYDPGREGDKLYTGGGDRAGYYERTPKVVASFHPKEDMLVCTVTDGEYGGKFITYDFTGKR